MDNKILISKELEKLYVSSKHIAFKSNILNSVDLSKPLIYDKKSLILFLNRNFDTKLYTYEEMIDYARIFFPVYFYKQHNKRWVFCLKKILYKIPDFYYYRYHIELFFSKNEDLTCFIHNYSTLDEFMIEIKVYILKDLSNSTIKNLEKKYENILYSKNYLLSIKNMKIVGEDDILMYHVIRNNPLKNLRMTKLYKYISYETLEKILNLKGPNIDNFLKRDEDLTIYIERFFDVNYEERYPILSFLSNNKEEFDKKCILYALKKSSCYILSIIYKSNTSNFKNYIFDIIFDKSKITFIPLFVINFLNSLNLCEDENIREKLLTNCAEEGISIYFDKWIKEEDYDKYFELYVTKSMTLCYSYFLNKKSNIDIKTPNTLDSLIFLKKWDIFNTRINLFELKDNKFVYADFLKIVSPSFEIEIVKNIKIPQETGFDLFKLSLKYGKLKFLDHLICSNEFNCHKKSMLHYFLLKLNKFDSSKFTIDDIKLFNAYFIRIIDNFDQELDKDFPYIPLISKLGITDEKIFNFFLKRNININQTCDKGNTALHYAMMYNKYEIVFFLIKNGIDQKIKNLENRTCFYYSN